jgi:hypothetical protein
MRLAPLLTLLLLSPALAAQPSGSTIASGGGPASDIGESIAADVLSGEVAVVGTFEQTATFGSVSVTSADAPATRSDAFVVKYGADGVAQWARRMGTDVFNDFGAGVAITPVFAADAGSVYVSGFFTGIATFDGGANPAVSLTTRNDFDAFLAKYSPQGDLLWVQQAGGSGQDTGRGVAVDVVGRALWVGSFTGTSAWGAGATALTRTSAGSSDGFLARYLPDGTLDRLLTVGGDEGDDLRSVTAQLAFGGPSFVTGTFRSVAFFGATPLQSRGLSDVAVIRVDDDGVVEWARQVGGSGNDYARGLALSRDDRIGVGGSFENTTLVGTDVLTSAGASDAFLAVYDAEGAEVGAVRGGGAGFDIANGVAATPRVPIATLGGLPDQTLFVLTGYLDGAGTFGTEPVTPQGLDAFAALYADGAPPDGGPALLDVLLVGGTNSDRGNGATMGLYGEELLLTGSFRGDVTFGGGAVTSAGSNDVFVARIPLCPAYSCLPVADEGGPEASAVRLSVAPNPSRTPTVTVRLEAPADATVEVVDALGRVHAVLHRGSLAQGETRLSPGPLAPGVYVVRVRGGVEARRPFVVVR